jgi:hypothetical protein
VLIRSQAEEDAARRYNIGRLTGNTRYGAGPRSKRTDLFGPELKAKLDRMGEFLPHFPLEIGWS